MQYSIGIATEQSFRYIKLTDAKIWISKNAPLCRVLANRVTFKIARCHAFQKIEYIAKPCRSKNKSQAAKKTSKQSDSKGQDMHHLHD